MLAAGPARDAAQEWIEDGLLAEQARAIVAGAAQIIRLAGPLWPAAVREGLVQGDPADLVTRAVDRLEANAGIHRAAARTAGDPGRGVRREDVNRIFRYVRRVLKEGAVELQASYDADFLTAAEDLTRRAALERWGRQRYIDAVDDLARSYGMAGVRGGVAATWHRTVILNAGYNRGMLLAFGHEPTRRLFPFLAFRDVGDARVRPSHHLLDGFVALSNWPGWENLVPPLDWNCRCRLVPVNVQVARILGWYGHDFPRGEGFLLPRQVGGQLVIPGRPTGFRPPLGGLDAIMPF